MIISLSVLLMTLIHERYVFLYAIMAIFGYGAFLTMDAFMDEQSANVQLLYIYNHLLFTSFLLLYWVLINKIKKTGYENERLKLQVKALERYHKRSHILTLNEFVEQAKIIYNGTVRRQEEAWLLRIYVQQTNDIVQRNLQETLEIAALQSVRADFDIVTVHRSTIFILLQNTREEGVTIVQERFRDLTKQKLNYVEPPYYMVQEKVTEPITKERLVEESA